MDILEKLKGLITDEINMPNGAENVYISIDTYGGSLTTYDKVVAKSARIPNSENPGITVETITITRTERTNI